MTEEEEALYEQALTKFDIKLKYLSDELKEKNCDVTMIQENIKSLSKEMEDLLSFLEVEDFLLNGPGVKDGEYC
jgi:hypothetical protein